MRLISLLFLVYIWAHSGEVNPARRIGYPNWQFAEGSLSLDISLDERLAAIGTNKGRVVLVDLRKLVAIKELEISSASVSVSFLPDGSLLAIQKNGGVKAVDARSGSLKWELASLGGEIRRSALSADGTRLAYALRSGEMAVLEIPSGRKISSLAKTTQDAWGTPWELAIAPGGERVASASRNGDISVWNVAQATRAWSYQAYDGSRDLLSVGVAGPHYGPPRSMESLIFSKDGRTLAAGGASGELLVFDAVSGKKIFEEKKRSGGMLNAIRFLADGSLVAAYAGGPIRRIQPQNGKDIFSVSSYPGHFRDIQPTQNEKRLYALEGEFLTARDARTGQRLFPRMTRTVWRAVYSRDGRTLAVGGTDGAVELFSMPGGRLIARTAENPEPVVSVALSPDASVLAAINSGYSIRTFDAATGKLIWEQNFEDSRLGPVAFLDDKTLVASEGRTMTTWDVGTGKRRELGRNPNEAVSLAVSPNGRFVGVGGENGQIYLWEMPTGKVLFRKPDVVPRFTSMNDISFTPDSQQVIGRDHSRDVLFRFSIPDGGLMQTIPHGDHARDFFLTPDGKRMILSKDDGRLARWTITEIMADGKERVLLDSAALGPMLAISPGGSDIVTAGNDGVLSIWRLPLNSKN